MHPYAKAITGDSAYIDSRGISVEDGHALPKRREPDAHAVRRV
jgi:hypothetical protein